MFVDGTVASDGLRWWLLHIMHREEYVRSGPTPGVAASVRYLGT